MTPDFGAVLGMAKENGPSNTVHNLCKKGIKCLAPSDLDHIMDTFSYFRLQMEPDLSDGMPEKTKDVLKMNNNEKTMHFEDIDQVALQMKVCHPTKPHKKNNGKFS